MPTSSDKSVTTNWAWSGWGILSMTVHASRLHCSVLPMETSIRHTAATPTVDSLLPARHSILGGLESNASVPMPWLERQPRHTKHLEESQFRVPGSATNLSVA